MIELLLALLLKADLDEHADFENAGDIYCAQLLEAQDE